MKKKILIGLILAIVIAAGLSLYSKMKKDQERIGQEKALQAITDRFNTYVVTNKDAILYEFKDGTYHEIGNISAGYPLELEKETFNLDTTHFRAINLDAYISIQDVEVSKTKADKNTRYKHYVAFNENVKTNDVTRFFDANDNVVLTLNRSFDFPIVIKDVGKYGIEFDGGLYYVKDVEKTYPANNTDMETREDIRTFTYHTVYDTHTQICASVEICHPLEQFDEHMKYLKDNGFLTLTMEELEMFLDDKIRVPLKTVVITLDDGIFLENSIPIVEKYEINATFFIITSRIDVAQYMDSKYAQFESHTNDMHNNYRCPKNTSYSQGGQMLCEDYDKIIADLKLSQEKLNGSHYFAYPFFDVNARAQSALRETRFHLAFIGQYNTNGYSNHNTDKMMIRRTTIFGNYSLDMFVDFCNDLD